MKYLFAIVLAAIVCSCLAEERMQLPPGFESPQELVNVLANEPEAAQNARFASAPSDVITFKDSGASSTGYTAPNAAPDAEREAAESEFDPQIEEITKNVNQIKTAIKESEECARRLTEQKAELRSLEEQKEHLEKEKEKKILEDKLTKQMKDLSEINRMSRSLRTKFQELKRTQELIKTRMSGTRSSLSQLDADDDVDANEVKDNAKNIAADVEALHQAQARLLTRSHQNSVRAVKQTLQNANQANDREQKTIQKEVNAAERI